MGGWSWECRTLMNTAGEKAWAEVSRRVAVASTVLHSLHTVPTVGTVLDANRRACHERDISAAAHADAVGMRPKMKARSRRSRQPHAIRIIRIRTRTACSRPGGDLLVAAHTAHTAHIAARYPRICFRAGRIGAGPVLFWPSAVKRSLGARQHGSTAAWAARRAGSRTGSRRGRGAP